MQTRKTGLSICLAVALALALVTGCKMLQPVSNPDAPSEITYVVAPAVSNIVDTVRGVIRTVPLPQPVTPIAEIVCSLLLGGVAVWGKLRTVIERHKREKALLIDAIEEGANKETKAAVAKRVASVSSLGMEVKERTK